MNSLAGHDHGQDGGFGGAPQPVAESARRIDHHFRRRAKFLSAFKVARNDAIDESHAIFIESRDFDIVQQRRTLLESSEYHVNEQARVIELAVIVNRSTTEAFSLEGWEPFQRFLAREQARLAESVLAGEKLVELQTQAIKRSFPPVVIRDDECEVSHQVGSIL